MTDTTYKKSVHVDRGEPFVITSMPHKSKNDGGCNTTSSTFIGNLSTHSLSPDESISFDHISSFSDQLFSITHSLALDLIPGNVKNTHEKDSAVVLTSPLFTNQEYSKKLKSSSDLHMKIYQINTFLKYGTCQFSTSKNFNVCKIVNHKRINLEGQRKIDFMYYLAKRHNFVPVTEKIFSFLGGKDIIAISLVSKIWHSTVKYSPSAKMKRKSYLTYFQSVKENHGYFKLKHSSISSRKTFANISNTYRSPLKKIGLRIH